MNSIENSLQLSIDKEFDRQQLKGLDGRYDDLQEWSKHTMKKLRRKATPEELKVAWDLFRKKIKFYPQALFYLSDVGKVVFVDFLLPDCKVVLEIDGDFHKRAKNIVEDLVRDGCFKSMGYTVVRIRNEEVGSDKYWQIFTFFRKNPQNCQAAYQAMIDKKRIKEERRKSFAKAHPEFFKNKHHKQNL